MLVLAGPRQCNVHSLSRIVDYFLSLPLPLCSYSLIHVPPGNGLIHTLNSAEFAILASPSVMPRQTSAISLLRCRPLNRCRASSAAYTYRLLLPTTELVETNVLFFSRSSRILVGFWPRRKVLKCVQRCRLLYLYCRSRIY
jgi:hypothetical protein